MTDFDFSAHKVIFCDVDPESIDIARTTYLDNNIGDFIATPSPKLAVKHIAKINPDLILLALKMPDVDVIDIVRQIRNLDDGAFYKTPILLLLEKVSQETLREACRAGIEGALRKPISPEKLLRFTRAVILKPRRFVCLAKYFGPERRMRDDPHFDGNERRCSLEQDDFNLSNFTRSRPVGGVTLNASRTGGTPRSSSPASNLTSRQNSPIQTSEALTHSKKQADTDKTDWPSTKDRGQADEATLTFSDDELKPVSPAPKDDYDLIDSPVRDIPADKPEGSPSPALTEVAPAPKNDTAQEKSIQIEPVGPDGDDFEEIIDLDECLDLHKLWVNSGGRGGLQANRSFSDFRGQDIVEADFTKAILPQSNFENVNCTGIIFRKADLSGSTFRNALLSSADLRVSRLTRADLRNARLDKANMLGTDLSGANLEGATLRGVNLSGANLHRTNLCGVNLSMTKGLIREQIRRAITDTNTRLPASLKETP